jgi:hypothetical protein
MSGARGRSGSDLCLAAVGLCDGGDDRDAEPGTGAVPGAVGAD